MYTIKVDGQVLYSPALSDAYRIISPTVSLELNKAGSMSFTMPPGHAMYDAIQKMKSIITVEQDGEEIFRGRVLDDVTDFYNQKKVYCEGELAFLMDSLQRPYEYEGTVEGFLRKMLKTHNEQVDEEKRFSVGNITAVDDSVQLALENAGYSDTLTTLESALIDMYEGFFVIRHEGGVRYLDYLRTYDANSSQKIEFGVNLLELDNEINAKDIFTVLVPLGGINKKGEVLTVESVNDGLDYIENAEAIAQYGRIVKTHSWDYITDAAELYEVGFKKLMNATTDNTITIKAVDLHLLNGDTDKISLGDNVHLLSEPHGLDREYTCEAMEIDIFNPEKTVYTFGKKIDTLVDSAASMVNQLKRHSGDIFCHLRHIKELDHAVTINIQHMDEAMNKLSAVAVEVDAAKAEIALKASQYSVDELGYRTTNAELRLDGAEAEIETKVSKDGVVSAINQTPEAVTINAGKINLSGYVTASQLNAEASSIRNSISTSIVTSSLSAHSVNCSTLTLTDASLRLRTIKYLDADGNVATMVVPTT